MMIVAFSSWGWQAWHPSGSKTFSFLVQELEAFPGYRLQTDEPWAKYGPHMCFLYPVLYRIFEQIASISKMTYFA